MNWLFGCNCFWGLLLCLPPLAMNVFSWATFWQRQEYRLDCFLDFMQTPSGRRALFGFSHSWERLLFVVLIVLYLTRPDWVWMTYFAGMGIAAAFAVFRFVRGGWIFPRWTNRMLLILGVMFLVQLILMLIIFLNLKIVMPAAYTILVLSPLYAIGLAIFLTWPISFYLRKKVMERAMALRATFKGCQVIGVTGSFGKSSVKKFLATILSEAGEVRSTPANINTEMGVSQFILGLKGEKFDYLVAEMGAYKKGEIALLGEIVQPDFGVLTGINEAHMGIFGSIENTIKAKGEITKSLAKKSGKIFLNFDNGNVRLVEIPQNVEVVSYGIRADDADARSHISEFTHGRVDFTFDFQGAKHKFHTSLLGQHNILNLTGVIALCFELGMSSEQIQKGLDKLELPKRTMCPIEIGKAVLINDTYNANPDGVLAGCDSLHVFDKAKKRAIVLDDILELGTKSDYIHEKVAHELANFGLDEIYLVGSNFAEIVRHSLIKSGFSENKIFVQPKKIREGLNSLIESDSVILFEGRRASASSARIP